MSRHRLVTVLGYDLRPGYRPIVTKNPWKTRGFPRECLLYTQVAGGSSPLIAHSREQRAAFHSPFVFSLSRETHFGPRPCGLPVFAVERSAGSICLESTGREVNRAGDRPSRIRDGSRKNPQVSGIGSSSPVVKADSTEQGLLGHAIGKVARPGERSRPREDRVAGSGLAPRERATLMGFSGVPAMLTIGPMVQVVVLTAMTHGFSVDSHKARPAMGRALDGPSPAPPPWCS